MIIHTHVNEPVREQSQKKKKDTVKPVNKTIKKKETTPVIEKQAVVETKTQEVDDLWLEDDKIDND